MVSILLVMAFGVLFGQSAQAATGINQAVHFQGKVVNANGTNVTDGTYDFVFKFYDAASSGATNLYTESWTAAALWSSTMSSAPTSGAESLTYSSDTNESTIKVGQILTNTTKSESVVVVAVNTGTNVITISPTRQAWATSDTVTNKLYVKDGIFQVAINTLNADLSGVNFNTDNIFLGVNFNGDGEMKPRIQYTAVPYAFNARKVAGLTVTDTTGTFTLAAGKTLTVNNTITFSGTDSTTLTLPSSSDTLVGLAATQTLTNKTLTSPVVGGALTLNGSSSGTIAFQAAATSSNVTFTLPAGDGTGGYVLSTNGTGTLSWIDNGAGGAPTDGTYVTLSTNGSLSGERVLAGTTNQVAIADGGANGNITLSTPQNIHTSATPQFSTLGLGAAAVSDKGLLINNAALSGTSQYGLSSAPTFASSATTAGYGLNIAPATAASAFTMTNLYGLYVADASKGAGSTITTQYGLYIADQTQGGTNYAFYSAGTAQSYFGGNVGIKTTPGSELDVKGTIRLSGSSSGYVGLKGAAAAGSTSYTLPSADGTAGQVLSTNGSATLSWATAVDNTVAGGRLTLTSGTPVTTSDVTGATTVYYAPHKGSRIALYDGANWNIRTFSEKTCTLTTTCIGGGGALTSDKNYDLFIYDDNGTPTFDSPVAWTNNTTRATAIQLQDGVYVKSGATTRRYVGTIRTTSTTTTEDSTTKRFVWNYDNRVARTMRAVDTTDTWEYSAQSWRQANANSANQLDFVVGVSEDTVESTVYGSFYNSTASYRNAYVGIGLDSTTANSASITPSSSATNAFWASLQATYRGLPGIGRHYFVWLEFGAGSDTQTFGGDFGEPTVRQTGIVGVISG